MVPDGHKKVFDSYDLSKRIRRGFSTKGFFENQAALQQLHLADADEAGYKAEYKATSKPCHYNLFHFIWR